MLVVALVLNAGANLLLKFHDRYMKPTDLTLTGAASLWPFFLNNWLLWLGLLCFASNVIFYRIALGKLPISVAYPIMVGAGFAIIAVVAWRFLGETLSVGQWAGVALILAGIVLVAREVNPATGG